MDEPLARMVSILRRTPGVDEFNAVARACERAEIQAGADVVRRHASAAWIEAAVHRDIGRGRGSTRLHVTADVQDPAALVTAAVARAAAAVGPAWRLPPPAAPARVQVADPALDHDLERAAETLLQEARARLAGPGGARAARIPADARVRTWHVAVERCRTAARTSAGLASGYDSTLLAVEVVLEHQGRIARARTWARRRQDLEIGRMLARALRRLGDRARAAPLAPGRYDLVLSAGALAPDPAAAPDPGHPARMEMPAGFASIQLDRVHPGHLGWLGPFAAQADGRLLRLGLTRYRPGQPVGGPGQGDPLTLTSDGTIPYGLLSRPFGDLGEPVRRFVLVKDNTAAGLALDLREAALHGVTANGGVRNLVLAPGGTEPAALRAATDRPVIEVVDLAWLEVDPRSGELVAEIGLGYAAGRTPVTGGSFRGNLFDMLTAARLSSKTVRTGWYQGPAAARFADLAIT